MYTIHIEEDKFVDFYISEDHGKTWRWVIGFNWSPVPAGWHCVFDMCSNMGERGHELVFWDIAEILGERFEEPGKRC